MDDPSRERPDVFPIDSFDDLLSHKSGRTVLTVSWVGTVLSVPTDRDEPRDGGTDQIRFRIDGAYGAT